MSSTKAPRRAAIEAMKDVAAVRRHLDEALERAEQLTASLAEAEVRELEAVEALLAARREHPG